MKNDSMRRVRRALRQLPWAKRHNKAVCHKKLAAVEYGERTGDYSRYWAMMPKTLK